MCDCSTARDRRMVNANREIALEKLIIRNRRIILIPSDAFRWPGPLLSHLGLGRVKSRGGRGANGLVVLVNSQRQILAWKDRIPALSQPARSKRIYLHPLSPKQPSAWGILWKERDGLPRRGMLDASRSLTSVGLGVLCLIWAF